MVKSQVTIVWLQHFRRGDCSTFNAAVHIKLIHCVLFSGLRGGGAWLQDQRQSPCVMLRPSGSALGITQWICCAWSVPLNLTSGCLICKRLRKRSETMNVAQFKTSNISFKTYECQWLYKYHGPLHLYQSRIRIWSPRPDEECVQRLRPWPSYYRHAPGKTQLCLEQRSLKSDLGDLMKRTN